MPAPFGLSAPAAFDADTEIPDVGDKIALTDGSARTWYLTRLDPASTPPGDAPGLDPGTYQNAGVSDFTEGTVADTGLTRIVVPAVSVNVSNSTLTIDLTNALIGDTLYLFSAKRGGTQSNITTINTVEGVSTTLVDRTSTTVSRSKVGVWKVTVNGDMAANAAASVGYTATGSEQRFFCYIVRGTITTETVTKGESTAVSSPISMNVATGAGGLAFGCVSVEDGTAGGSSWTAGLTQDDETIVSLDLMASGSVEGTTAETRTITYTHDSPAQHAAWLSLAVS